MTSSRESLEEGMKNRLTPLSIVLLCTILAFAVVILLVNPFSVRSSGATPISGPQLNTTPSANTDGSNAMVAPIRAGVTNFLSYFQVHGFSGVDSYSSKYLFER